MAEQKEDQKLYFDLKLLEIALNKAIEVCGLESQMVSSKLTISLEELDRICEEKEDLINFIEWHIPLIVRYIKMHQKNLDDGQDISNLAIRAAAIDKVAQNAIRKRLPIVKEKVIGNEKSSTLTIIHADNHSKPVLEVVFLNDYDETPKKISILLKKMMVALEENFNKISSRKHLNDQILSLMSESIAVAKKQKKSYNPKKREVFSENETLIYDQDC